MTTEERTRDELAEDNRKLRERLAELERERDAALPLTALFAAHPIPMILYRADGLALAVNEALCAMSGLPAESMAGKLNLLTDPHSIELGYAAAFERALAGEVVRLPPNSFEPARAGIEGAEPGKVYWSETTYVPLPGAGGERFIAEIIVDITSQKSAETQVHESAALLTAIIDNAPMMVYVKDRAGRFTLVNRQVEELLATPRERMLGRTDGEFFPPELAEGMRAQDEEVLAAGPKTFEEQIFLADGEHTFITTKFPLRRSDAAALEVAGLSTDITARVRAEAANRRLEEQVIRAHEEALRALSTPLLPIAEGVLVMPLIGEVNAARAQQVLETLLRGICEQQARVAILDITGVNSAGATTAGELTSALIRLGSAVKLLGAELVITGVQPGVARILAELGADAQALLARGTLQSGVQYALARTAERRR